MMDITRQLAEFTAGTRFADMPAAVRHEGVRTIVNFVGCTFGGGSNYTEGNVCYSYE